METIAWIQNHWFEILAAGGFIVSGASIVVKWTETKVDDEWLEKFKGPLCNIPCPR